MTRRGFFARLVGVAVATQLPPTPTLATPDYEWLGTPESTLMATNSYWRYQMNATPTPISFDQAQEIINHIKGEAL